MKLCSALMLWLTVGVSSVLAGPSSPQPPQDPFQVTQFYGDATCSRRPRLVLYRQVPAVILKNNQPSNTCTKSSNGKYASKVDSTTAKLFDDAQIRFGNTPFVLIMDQSVSGTSNCARMRYLGATALPVTNKCTPVYDSAGNLLQSVIVKVTTDKVVVGKYWDTSCQEGTVTEITRNPKQEAQGYCKHANLFRVFDGTKQTTSTKSSKPK